jgi:CheY-like chemotaxis protein
VGHRAVARGREENGKEDVVTEERRGQMEISEEVTREKYGELLKAIRRNMDPHSNTVLLVDDERAIRMKVARDVRQFDPEAVVMEAANGKEALEKLEEIRKKYYRDPLLIVLDLQMPVMDGWEVIRRLKKDYEDKGKTTGIPIVVLSSSTGEKSVMPFVKRSVHEHKTGYDPLVTVAKEACVDSSRYDAAGPQGLLSWLEHFLNA